MKKIGKNAKLYLLGMLTGGIGFGLTTVAADTIINSGSVAYKTTTVKAALDNLYEAADLKPRVEALESYFNNNPTSYFDGSWLNISPKPTNAGLRMRDSAGNERGHVYYASDGDGVYVESRAASGEFGSGKLSLYGNPVIINNTNFEDMFVYSTVRSADWSVTGGGSAGAHINIEKSGYTPLSVTCETEPSQTTGSGHIYAPIIEQRLASSTTVYVALHNFSSSTVDVYGRCQVLYVKKTSS